MNKKLHIINSRFEEKSSIINFEHIEEICINKVFLNKWQIRIFFKSGRTLYLKDNFENIKIIYDEFLKHWNSLTKEG